MANAYAATARTKSRIAAKASGASTEQVRSISAPAPAPSASAPAKLSYEQASENLNRGGLKGEALRLAHDSLKTSYASLPTAVNDPATAEPVADKPKEESEYVPRYYAPETTITEPEPVEQIQRRMQKDAQKEINSLREYESTLLQEQQVTNDKNDRSTQARSVLSGLSGSSEADIAQMETSEKGKKANEAIRASVEMKVQDILSSIRKDAVTEARAQRGDAAQDITTAAARMELASKSLSNLAASGVTFEGLRTKSPQEFEHLARQFGGTEALRGAFVLNTPADQILDKQIKGGSYVIARQNPLTGKITVETVDLGLPPEYTKTVDAGDRILAIPDGWDGDPSKLLTINKGLTPSQAGGDYGGYNEDQSKVIRAVDDKVSKNATYVKTNNMRGYVDNVSTSLAQATGTGDLAAINQFQKVIDEGAVTRDQDVKLIQNSQSLLNKLKTYEKKLTKGEQLSPALRSEMLTAVNSMYEAQVKALNKDPFIQSKKSELERYGMDPNDTIIGELGAFSAGGSRTLTKDGQSFDASDLTNEEYEQALQDGYTAE